MFSKQGSLAALTKEQKEMQTQFLQESLQDHKQKVQMEKAKKEEELRLEKEGLKRIAQEDKDFKVYMKESTQRQQEIMMKINQDMVDQHKQQKADALRDRQDCWGSNIFFEKMWEDKGVG